MKRIGCTKPLGSRAICVAAGIALAAGSAFASAPETGSAPQSTKLNSVVSTELMPIAAFSDLAGGPGVFVQTQDVIGVDGGCDVLEGEPCVVPLPLTDCFNGGCNCPGANPINPPLTNLPLSTVMCGQTARALDPNDNVTRRDTDWYRVTIGPGQAGDYVISATTSGGGQLIVGTLAAVGGVPLLNPSCAGGPNPLAGISPFVQGPGGGQFTTQLFEGEYWVFVSVPTTVVQGCTDYELIVAPESFFFGACCQAFGACSEVLAADCTALGGIFQGVGTNCASADCPEILPPDNNECDSAQVITAADVNGADIAGTNLGATAAFGLPVCGGPLSGPAVWYVYDATTLGFQTVTVSTCNTGTLPASERNPDTVINVFTNSIPDFCLGTFCCVAGNDDAADPACGLYSEVSFCADPSVDGGQYFIVVSGFDGAQGSFLLSVSGNGTACDQSLCVECQAGDVLEGEPCPSTPDTFNGGCNSTPNVFSSLVLNQTVCGTVQAQGGTRDTDWYEIVITEAGNYEVVFQAGFAGVAGFIGATAGVPLVNPTCAQIAVIAVLTTPAPCEEGIASAFLTPGFYWIFASSTEFEGVSCPDNAECPGNGQYRLTVRPAAAIVPCPVTCPSGAVAECEACADQQPPAPADSDCCFANGSAGCDDAACEATVCAVDAFCCETEWDGICADLAADLCGTLCDVDGADSCNGGCNNAVFAAQAIDCGDSVCGTITAGFGLRDTDWYQIVVKNPDGAVITASLEAAFNGVVFILSVPDCDNISILGETGFSACVDGTSSGQPAVASVGPGTYYVFVSSGNADGSGIFEGITCGNNADYVLTVTGDCAGGPVCPCVADINGDCVVNADDLGILLGDWGCSGSGCVADINGDGVVNADDLGILLGDWGCAG